MKLISKLQLSAYISSHSTTKNIVLFLAFTLILFIGVGLRIHNLSTVKFRHTDEYIYTYQAYNIATYGTKGIQRLIAARINKPKHAFYPPPSRIGYTSLLSLMMKVTHNYSIGFGANLSCFFSILSLLLIIIFGLRFFNPWSTLISTLFLATSPIAIALARRTWQDAMTGFFGALLLYITCEIITNPRRRSWLFLLVLLGGLGLLIKSSLVVFFAFCMIWILWDFVVLNKYYAKAIRLSLFAGLSILLFSLILINYMGGITNLIAVLTQWKNAMPTNLYVIRDQMGPWYHIFVGYWLLGQSNAILFAIAFMALPIMRFISHRPYVEKTQYKILLGILLITVAFTLIAGIVPYSQNVRYISQIFLSFYLIAGFMLYLIFALLKKYLKIRWLVFVLLATVIVVAIGIQEYNLFQKMFIQKRLVGTAVGAVIKRL